MLEKASRLSNYDTFVYDQKEKTCLEADLLISYFILASDCSILYIYPICHFLDYFVISSIHFNFFGVINNILCVFFHSHAIRFNAFLPVRRNSIKIDGSIPIPTINYHAISHDFSTQEDYIFWIFSTLFFFVGIDGFARRNMANIQFFYVFIVNDFQPTMDIFNFFI